jgi:uncharacterized protein (DUF2267 family)
MVQFRTLVADVQRQARIPAPDLAIALLRAFLTTLAERLQSRDAFALSRRLPKELATYLLSPPRAHGETFDAEQFVFRVAQRSKHSEDAVRRLAPVIGALIVSTHPPELREKIPQDIRALLLL